MNGLADNLSLFIAAHGQAVVASTPTTVTTCAVWTQGKRFGWRIETHPADLRKIREWLGY